MSDINRVKQLKPIAIIQIHIPHCTARTSKTCFYTRKSPASKEKACRERHFSGLGGKTRSISEIMVLRYLKNTFTPVSDISHKARHGLPLHFNVIHLSERGHHAVDRAKHRCNAPFHIPA